MLKSVSIGSRTVNVFDAGSGQVLLLVHGFPLDHSMWQSQFELSSQFRIIAPDLPGFGNRQPADEIQSMKSYADDLEKLLDAMGVEEPLAFCGLSMGGYIGWEFWRHHRNRLSHLIACDTRAANDSQQVARARKIAADSVIKTGAAPVADSMIEKLIYDFENPAKREIVQLVHNMIASTEPESIAQGQLAMSERTDATDWLAEIDLPTLFVVGAFDSITPPDEMRADADAVAGSKFVQIDNAGHLSPLENPREFNRVLIEFLNNH